jgi:two-component system sensor histidine kinase KdpD
MKHPSNLLLIDAPRSRVLGLAVAAGAVLITTLLIYPLRPIAPVLSTGVVYLLAVLLVSTYWGLGLGLVTALASAASFNFFHIHPTGWFTIADPQNWVALAVYLLAAAIASTLADLARSRATDADRRRQEADLAADAARALLGGASLADALPAVAERVSAALDTPGLRIVLDDVAATMTAVPLRLGSGRRGAVVLPAGAEAGVADRLRERVVPSLEALLTAALDREALQVEVVETAALRQSDVVKTAVLRAVSHDLRSPLTAIIAAGSAVGSAALSPEERDELSGVVVGEATRLARLVEKLLDLSKLQADAAGPRRDWCSVEEVVREAVDSLADREEIGDTELSFDRGLPLVQADAAQLERVFVNLLENAHRHSGGHPVKVRARVVGGRMAVRVLDRGPGLEASDVARIFEPFQRSTANDGHPGAGLGLAIVKGFVEANGGRVSVQSMPGHGTAVAIELPLAEAAVGGTAR